MSNNVIATDMLVWKAHRQKITSKLHIFCRRNSYPIIGFQDFSKIPAKSTKVVYIRIGDLIEEYPRWVEFNNLCIARQKTVFVITDNFYNYQDLSNVKFFMFTELNGVFATDEPLQTQSTKSKLYNCFINRSESTRQSWFYFLYHYNLLDQGYVSFLLNNLPQYSQYQGKELFDYIHLQFGMNQLPHFESAYQSLKNQVPFQNFKEISDLLPYIADSKYSLVLETCAADPTTDKWHYSEKTFRALQQPTIPLLFVQSRGIKLLQSLGFELYVDQLYMDCLSWQERQQELLKILINDSIHYNQDRAIKISLHNRQVLKNMLLLASKNDYFDKFFDSIVNH